MKTTLLLFTLVLALSAVNAQEFVPLKTEFPPPLVLGTPVTPKLSNLERRDPNEKQELLVPAGTVNLALGKTVTSSDSEPLLGSLDLITDGDKSADEGAYVELGPGKQWVQIDLGTRAEIHAIWLWHYHSQMRAYKDVVIQVCDDEDFIGDVVTLFNNDDDNSIGLGSGKDFAYIETFQGRLIPAGKGGVQGRYVRLYSGGNTSDSMNHYIEVEVFGKARP